VSDVEFLDLATVHKELRAELLEACSTVLDGGRYVLGREVEAFESEFAEYCRARHCVGVGNGFDALRLLLRAAGLGPGDEVIVPAYTAVATWLAVSAVGATPVGVDVDNETLNLDPVAVEPAITPATRAIIAVHLLGQPADIEALSDLAARHDLRLFEDAAQAHGARHRERRVGGLADAAAFSFYPTKNLGCLGDGGAVTTHDEQLAFEVRRLRSYGWQERSVSEIKGVNTRLDELQAALLRVKLRHLDEWNARRRAVASRYAFALANLPIVLPHVPAWAEPVWHLYVVGTDPERRDATRASLERAGVGTLVHYDPLPHLTPAYRADGWKPGDLPVAEARAAGALSLPMHTSLDDEAIDRVVTALREVVT
jgi:dTDP-3-amino-3,4,6-trideoxy-alpha-D-glucose transaminase